MPFKIYADFESILRGVQRVGRDNNTSYTKKYQEHIAVLLTKLCAFMIDSVNQLLSSLMRFLNSMSIVGR